MQSRVMGATVLLAACALPSIQPTRQAFSSPPSADVPQQGRSGREPEPLALTGIPAEFVSAVSRVVLAADQPCASFVDRANTVQAARYRGVLDAIATLDTLVVQGVLRPSSPLSPAVLRQSAQGIISHLGALSDAESARIEAALLRYEVAVNNPRVQRDGAGSGVEPVLRDLQLCIHRIASIAGPLPSQLGSDEFAERFALVDECGRQLLAVQGLEGRSTDKAYSVELLKIRFVTLSSAAFPELFRGERRYEFLTASEARTEATIRWILDNGTLCVKKLSEPRK